ncbi:nuclear transport factor 2 family protein [Amycolatopsis cihanbeyliensis]|uniref:SnoaL-like protein n=1 Tax=Amycolatopsis cihanbeyliensis TaxID=1128664 RepID=A0A542DQ26_AMYCI|nr:nuclear transport factor 2 family protein [Amycolatopsis cihanbeyliensis]TQJ05209.1 SnoaL-like protein [Amycolatopsis cihanbeyliensis]
MRGSLDQLLDEQEITRLLVAHCASIDDGRFAVTASLYADATWWICDGKPLHGTGAVTTFLNEDIILYAGLPRTRHMLATIDIEVDNDRATARSRSNVVVHQKIPDKPSRVIFQGRYLDTFHRVDGIWRWYERRMRADGEDDMSTHLRSATSPLET